MCTETCSNFNYLAILVASLAYFALGSVWYSPLLFGSAWQKLVNITMKPEKSEMIRLFSTTFVLGAVSMFVLEYFIKSTACVTAGGGIGIGLISAIGYVATTIGTTFMYEGKPMKLYLIDTSYHVAGFLIGGAIMGAWQ
ncbi:MAG: DUF1761 domain-containing protein [Cytophagaceae bacterium]